MVFPHYCISVHDTIVTCSVVGFSETTTWIFFVWPDTVATESIVAWPEEEGLVTVTDAVELAEVTVYGWLTPLPRGNAGFLSSRNRASSAPAVAADSALDAAATP